MRCYLNGEWLPLEKAQISVLDRGFLFGDGVYEVVAIYHRCPLHWQWHKERLQHSLDRIKLPFDINTLDEPLARLITESEFDEQQLYLQITRGVATKRQHQPPSKITPTVFMMTNNRQSLAEEKLIYGVNCVTLDDFRWKCGDIKSISLLAAVMLADQTNQAGADEVVLFRDGLLTEGFSGNYLVVQSGKILTPPADERLLQGITCRAVMTVAKRLGYTVDVRDINQSEVLAADELWLTSTVREIMPVTTLDGKPVGQGVPGPIFRQVHAAWHQYTQTPPP